MIDFIVNMLSINEYYGKSHNIEIAKGRYKIGESIKEGLEQRKRITKYNELLSKLN